MTVLVGLWLRGEEKKAEHKSRIRQKAQKIEVSGGESGAGNFADGVKPNKDGNCP